MFSLAANRCNFALLSFVLSSGRAICVSLCGLTAHCHIMLACVAQDRRKMITHFRVSGALRLNAEDPFLCIAVSVDEAHQRLGIAEGGMSRTTEAQSQRVTSGRQAAHEAVQSIPSESEPPSQPNGSEVTCATGGAEDFDARPARENAWHFLLGRTEREALEAIRGAQRKPCLFWPFGSRTKFWDGRQFLSPTSVTKMDDRSHALEAWENLEQRHGGLTGEKLPKDMRLACLLSMCPTDLQKELTAQHHQSSLTTHR